MINLMQIFESWVVGGPYIKNWKSNLNWWWMIDNNAIGKIKVSKQCQWCFAWLISGFEKRQYYYIAKFTLQGPANHPLRKTLLLAAHKGIAIESCWIKSVTTAWLMLYQENTLLLLLTFVDIGRPLGVRCSSTQIHAAHPLLNGYRENLGLAPNT